MSIVDWSKEGGISGFDMECDECGFSKFFDRTYFRDFIDEAKSNGWRVAKGADGEWVHLCPLCWKKGVRP